MGDDEGVGRVLETAGEGGEVPFVPGVLLGDEDLDDAELLARGGMERIGSLRGKESRREKAEAESGEAERETKGHSDLKGGLIGSSLL
jgi:hypothetical protein